jgi:hypothetical protein
MLSLILYGRNDNYGYNLHKRAAISLNCMSEILTNPDDEILFVDYNTPDDYPTFPEAIADTLTEKTKSLLRIFRVRPHIHRERFSALTHLKALEPVSRNVALRRSNPANPWVLSTNTDMIFVLQTENSLSEALYDFHKGFYCAPRIEIPETLWESYDRKNPIEVIKQTDHWGSHAHLNEIVYGTDTILFDAPGDFQLMQRQDLFKIDGFHEGMVLGWHVDSNISKRLLLMYGAVSDASSHVLGYHCDHTRQATSMHAHKSPENDSNLYVDQVVKPDLPEQKDSWGLADLELEEISLNSSSFHRYKKAIQSVITSPLEAPTRAFYRPENFNEGSATPEHILPFLLDIFSNNPPDQNIVWVGDQGPLFNLFEASWSHMGFSGRIVLGEEEKSIPSHSISAFIFNFGVPYLVGDSEMRTILERFSEIHQNEILHQKGGGIPRRIIGVNTINNRFESMMKSFVGCAKTPFSTRLRHGFFFSDTPTHMEWGDSMRTTSIGFKKEEGIFVKEGSKGCFVYGPYDCLSPGRYKACLSFTKPQSLSNIFPKNAGIVEFVSDSKTLQDFSIIFKRSQECSIEFNFTILPDEIANAIQFRCYSDGYFQFYLKSVVIEKLENSDLIHKKILGLKKVSFDRLFSVPDGERMGAFQNKPKSQNDSIRIEKSP